MLAQRFLNRVRTLADDIEATQMANIEKAARLAAEAMMSGHAFFMTEVGHGTQLELQHRGGGLVALRPFKPAWSNAATVGRCLAGRPREDGADAADAMMLAAVKNSELRPGDCVIVGSVSGRTKSTISLCLALRECGARLVGLTAMEYAAKVTSGHPSGKMLHELCDVVIDTCVPYGDACLEVDGLASPAVPLSGVAHATICWMICAEIMDVMIAAGKPPSVYMSANREGGPEYNRAQDERYNSLGY